MRAIFLLVAILALMCFDCCSAFAGWEVVILNSTGPTSAQAAGIFGGHKVKYPYFGNPAYAELLGGISQSTETLRPEWVTRWYIATISGIQDEWYTWASATNTYHAGFWNETTESWIIPDSKGATSSRALGVSSGQQVGEFKSDGKTHAVLWSGTAGSRVDLNPEGAISSIALGVSGDQQVGQANFNHMYRAGMWSGTAESWVDLNPAGAGSSDVMGISGGQQVGNVYFSDGKSHASLWRGTFESWVDLTPAAASFSRAHGVSGGQQVGTVYFYNLDEPFTSLWIGNGKSHASLWTGTAESWVDLNPAGAKYSIADGVSDGQQVGQAMFEKSHASLWSGTAESWVDLNPPEAQCSYATGVSGGKQVGQAIFTGFFQAGMWSGTAESWVNLHSLLPSGMYSESYARSIDVSDGEIWVVGYACNPIVGDYSEGYNDAILWHFTADPVPKR